VTSEASWDYALVVEFDDPAWRNAGTCDVGIVIPMGYVPASGDFEALECTESVLVRDIALREAGLLP